jgi:predicted nucleotidyltransferase
MDIEEIVKLLAGWARRHSLVKRVYIFGSRVRGDNRSDSDIDIAIELDPEEFQGSDESNGLATWMFEKAAWKEELQELIPHKVQLERYHEDQTPTVRKGIAQSSKLVYEKAT